MANATKQLPPLASLFQIDTTYVLRTFGATPTRLAFALAKVVEAEPNATGLLVITPTDTKAFSFAAPTQMAPVAGIGPNGPVAAAPPQPAPEDDLVARAAALAVEGERMEQQAVEAGLPDEALAAGMEVVGQTEGGSKVVKRAQRGPVAGAAQACGRCGGTGQRIVALEDGSSTQAQCPVCGGSGQVHGYGRGRSR